MAYELRFPVNEHVYLRNPDTTDIGKRIVKHGIDLISEIGFEEFNFKKLALNMGTTEATVYRYFENKHRLLLYIVSWYWFYLDFLLEYELSNLTDPLQKLKKVVYVLTHELPESSGGLDYDKRNLYEIVLSESSKVYFIKQVEEINQNHVFKPYKDLCAKIAQIIAAYNPDYKYPKSLTTTIIEAAHQQQYFALHLPGLTDVNAKNKQEFVAGFIDDLLFRALDWE